MEKRWKVRELITLVEKDGWVLLRLRGSHRQYKHPVKKGKVTIVGKPSDQPPPKTIKSIFQQAQLDPEG